MAEGLISAAAVGAPAQDASTIGNAPASVKACAKPPVGLVGDDEDRTLQRHGERVTRTAKGRNLRVRH